MRLIYPASAGTPELSDPRALAAAYAYPDVHDRTWVRANAVSSIDGAAQGPDGRSGSLSTPPDRRVLALLRALADVVFVGAGTARVERYGPVEPNPEHIELRRERGQAPAPPMAVVSRRLEFDPSAPLFTGALEMTGSSQRTIVFTVESAPADRRAALTEVADVIVAGADDVDVPTALGHLSDRGLRRVLTEGGPRLLADIARAGRLDELCYTIAPTLLSGEATRIVDGPPVSDAGWRLGHVIQDGDTLLTRWRAASARF